MQSPFTDHDLRRAWAHVRPALVSSQRPGSGLVWSAIAASTTGIALGIFSGLTGAMPKLLFGCIIAVFASTAFTFRARPIEIRWRWLPISSTILGYGAYIVTTSWLISDGWSHDFVLSSFHPNGPSFRSRFALNVVNDGFVLLLASMCAWHFGIMRLTRGQIIQLAAKA